MEARATFGREEEAGTLRFALVSSEDERIYETTAIRAKVLKPGIFGGRGRTTADMTGMARFELNIGARKIFSCLVEQLISGVGISIPVSNKDDISATVWWWEDAIGEVEVTIDYALAKPRA